MKLLIATHNMGKKKEFLDMLSSLFSDICLQDYPPSFQVIEDAASFRGNAVKKAKEAAITFGYVTIVDDSGLEVEALDNAPGIFSARFAGENATDEDNNRKLLRELKTKKNRKARYVAEVVLAIPEAELETLMLSERAKENAFEEDGIFFFCARGICEGEIVDRPKGEGGFGYDPYFYIPAWEKTLAEVSTQKKATISHRAKALEGIRKLLA